MYVRRVGQARDRTYSWRLVTFVGWATSDPTVAGRHWQVAYHCVWRPEVWCPGKQTPYHREISNNNTAEDKTKLTRQQSMLIMWQFIVCFCPTIPFFLKQQKTNNNTKTTRGESFKIYDKKTNDKLPYGFLFNQCYFTAHRGMVVLHARYSLIDTTPRRNGSLRAWLGDCNCCCCWLLLLLLLLLLFVAFCCCCCCCCDSTSNFDSGQDMAI